MTDETPKISLDEFIVIYLDMVYSGDLDAATEFSNEFFGGEMPEEVATAVNAAHEVRQAALQEKVDSLAEELSEEAEPPTTEEV